MSQHLFVRLLAACCLCLSGVLAAQGPTNPLSLAEALAWGVDNNLSIAGQRLGVEVAARNNNWVTAGRAPVVQATLGLNNSLNSQNNPASFLNGSFYTGSASAGLQANYTLFNGYRVRFRRRELGQLEAVANQQVRQLIETSVYAVTSAYYTAQLREATAQLAERRLAFSRDRLAFQQLRRSYGQGQAIELLQARTALLADSVAVERAGVEVDNAQRALFLELDAAEEEFAGRAIGDTLVFEPRDWQIERISRRLDSTANLDLLRTQEQLALTRTELARAALKPVLDVAAGLTHTRTAFRLSGEDPRTMLPGELVYGSTGQGSIGITGAYTLYDAGARRRQIQNALVNERVTNINLKNARQDAQIQARIALETYRNQRQLLDLQMALIENAAANLELAEEQLRAGSINSFDYRELQLNYFDAVQARLQVVYNILITDLELRRLTGELVERG